MFLKMHWKNSTRLDLGDQRNQQKRFTFIKEVCPVVIPCVFIFLCSFKSKSIGKKVLSYSDTNDALKR